MTLQIQNVLTRKKETFVPLVPGRLKLYLCGVTVYGRCHLGHLRCFLSFDAILRYFRYRGYEIDFVRNFTDIDDKIIVRAAEIEAGPSGDWRKGEAYANYDEAMWQARLEEDAVIRQRAQGQERHLAEIVSDHFIDLFHGEDFGPFDLLAPTAEPRVSRFIPQIIALIEKIIANGFAYESDGDVYFDVPAWHAARNTYGQLSGRDFPQLMEGARVAASEKKKSGTDFALWKRSKSGDPAWPSPWGEGRPGWHIECSAMSADQLGQPFDIHGGGKDLIFPHHENEIAQSEAALGVNYCNTWMHNGFITVDGVKMSKSLGNFITIKDGLEMAPPEVWRVLVLGTHYANPIDFSRTRKVNSEAGEEVVRGSIDIAFDRLEYFYETLKKADALSAGADAVQTGTVLPDPRVEAVEAGFVKAMDDDFNTAVAVAGIGEAMKYLNELCDLKAKAVEKLPGGRAAWTATIARVAADLRRTLDVLGLCGRAPGEALESLREFQLQKSKLDRKVIEQLIADRLAARGEKNWKRSDEIRDELLGLGVELRDGPTGTEWKVLRSR